MTPREIMARAIAHHKPLPNGVWEAMRQSGAADLFFREAQAVAKALRAAGWRIVPEIATEREFNAAWKMFSGEEWRIFRQKISILEARHWFMAVRKAMLAAAPEVGDE